MRDWTDGPPEASNQARWTPQALGTPDPGKPAGLATHVTPDGSGRGSWQWMKGHRPRIRVWSQLREGWRSPSPGTPRQGRGRPSISGWLQQTPRAPPSGTAQLAATVEWGTASNSKAQRHLISQLRAAAAPGTHHVRSGKDGGQEAHLDLASAHGGWPPPPAQPLLWWSAAGDPAWRASGPPGVEALQTEDKERRSLLTKATACTHSRAVQRTDVEATGTAAAVEDSGRPGGEDARRCVQTKAVATCHMTACHLSISRK